MTSFTVEDLRACGSAVGSAWRSGLDRDWSAQAGTLAWTCLATADHAVDAVLAVAFFLASGRQDSYPEWAADLRMGDAATPSGVTEAMGAAVRVVAGVVVTAAPGETGVIWLRPQPTARPAADFPPRAALELLLHGHDVCAGLGVGLSAPRDACARLIEHTRGWPHWSAPGWSPPTVDAGTDPWHALLTASGRGFRDN